MKRLFQGVTSKMTSTALVLTTMAASLVLSGGAGQAATQAPTPVGVSAAPGPAPAPPPPPYSIPWQLRPVSVGNVVRSDTSLAIYENANGQSGLTTASMLLATYKITPSLAPLVRLAVVQNAEPGPAVGTATAFVNPILGLVYAPKISANWKASAFLATTLPVGMGGDKAPGMDATAAAASRGIAARSGMDNAMFAVNYTTLIGGLGAAWVANKLTVQLEATVLELLRSRNEMYAPESARTNFTSGLHVGYFPLAFLSLGAELRYQRWLTTPGFVKANSAARDTTTIAIGPRFHFKAGGVWLRPGLSYSTALDKPVSDLGYHIFQLDVPVVF